MGRNGNISALETCYTYTHQPLPAHNKTSQIQPKDFKGTVSHVLQMEEAHTYAYGTVAYSYAYGTVAYTYAYGTVPYTYAYGIVAYNYAYGTVAYTYAYGTVAYTY